MSDQNLVFPVPAEWKGKTWLDEDGYRRAYAQLGDISTLADPAVVDGLIRERRAAS